jgi:hypothetical protein
MVAKDSISVSGEQAEGVRGDSIGGVGTCPLAGRSRDIGQSCRIGQEASKLGRQALAGEVGLVEDNRGTGVGQGTGVEGLMPGGSGRQRHQDGR